MNFIGTGDISTIEIVQHEICSVGIQCDLLAVAPLQKLPKGSATVTATIGYEIGDEEVDLDTGDADVEADHNSRDTDLDTSYQLSQEYIQAFDLPNLFSLTL